MSIYTLTLNPCIDRTVNVDVVIEKNGTHSVSYSTEDISGKGINISKILGSWGVNTHCIGLDYLSQKRNVKTELNKLNIANTLITLAGSLRTNIKIFEIPTGSMTEFNEKGEVVTDEIITGVTEKICEKIDQMNSEDIFVITGSMPPGFKGDYYYKLITYAKSKGVKTALDASGDNLINGVKGCPYIIKPNLSEFCTLIGRKAEGLEEIVNGALKIQKTGIEYVCITLGDKGTLLVHDGKAYYAEPMKLKIMGVQGAGDSVMAGMCVGIINNLPAVDILRYGVATAGGSLIKEGTKMCEYEDFKKMLPLVCIKEVFY